MTREEAVKIARYYAYAHHEDHKKYLPQTRDDLHFWEPHEWVIDAVLAAANDLVPPETTS